MELNRKYSCIQEAFYRNFSDGVIAFSLSGAEAGGRRAGRIDGIADGER